MSITLKPMLARGVPCSRVPALSEHRGILRKTGT